MSGGFGVPLIDFAPLGQAIGSLGQIGQREEAQKLLNAQLDAALAAQVQAPAAQAQTPLAALGTPQAAPDVSRALPTFAQGGDIGRYASAIQSNESGGKYGIVGPTHKKYGRALGAYQVMESNLPSWSKEAIGREVSPEEFLRSPQIQDAIFEKKFGQAVAKYGNPQDAASVWFTGRPLAQGANAKDVLGTTGAEYVRRFNGALGRAPAGSAPAQPATAMQMPAGGTQRPTAPVQVANAQADMPAPGAQPIGFNVPGQGGGDFVPGTEASPALATSRGAATPAPIGGLSPAANQRLSPAQVENLRAMLRNPLTQGHAAKIIEGLNKPDEFSFQVVGDQLVRTSKSGRAEVVPNITKPVQFQTFKGSDGNDYVFNPQTGQTTRAIEGRERQFTDLVSPDERAAAGVDPSYKGPVQRGPNGELRLPGKASTEVVMPAAEKAQDVKIGTQYGEVFNTAQAEGRSASGQLNTLRLMEKLIENPNFYSGAGSSTFVAAKRAAAALGVPGAQEAVAPNELFAKLASQSVLDKLGGNLGAGVSNADVSFITQTTANAANTPEGNRQIIQFGKALAQRQIDVAKLAREYAKSNGGRLDSGFDERLSQWAQSNPLFPEATAAQRAQQGGAAPAPQASAAPGPAAPPPPTPGTIMKGYRFKGGNPASPSSWEPVQQGPVT